MAENDKIYSYAESDREFIKRQIELYTPDIIICCGRGNGKNADILHDVIFSENEVSEWQEPISQYNYFYVTINGKRDIPVVSFYHPQMRGNHELFKKRYEEMKFLAQKLRKKQVKTLIEKLKGMGNRYFSAKVNHVCNLPDLHHGDNKQLMYALDTINEAISQHKKISFIYNMYGYDYKLHPKREEKYIVNPYQMVANNGFYYLIGNYNKYNDISHYRLDKMTSVEMLPDKVKPQNQVEGMEQGLNLPKHMAEHIYMFSGESVAINMLVEESIISELVDWFGRDFCVMEKRQDSQVLVRLKCNERAFFFWALQYGPYVEVLEPTTLRSKIADTVEKMNKKYNRK